MVSASAYAPRNKAASLNKLAEILAGINPRIEGEILIGAQPWTGWTCVLLTQKNLARLNFLQILIHQHTEFFALGFGDLLCIGHDRSIQCLIAIAFLFCIQVGG